MAVFLSLFSFDGCGGGVVKADFAGEAAGQLVDAGRVAFGDEQAASILS